MPHPVYHFGPSGFFALLLRRWVDVPVFLLVNIIIDLEVLAAPRGVFHRYWHFHTLLIGGLVGAAFGTAVYWIKPVRRFLEWLMLLVRLPYQSRLYKSVLAGILGVWVHVLVDGFYHYDVQMLWPYKQFRLWRVARRWWPGSMGRRVETGCLIFWAAAIAIYVFIVVRASLKQKSKEKPGIADGG